MLLTPLWAAAIALLPPVILLFPDGRLTSRPWRWMLWIYAGLVACVLAVVCAPAIAAVAGQDIRVDTSGDVRSARHLAGWLAHPPPWLAAVVLVLIVVIALSFVARQVLSWRRATGDRRQQLKMARVRGCGHDRPGSAGRQFHLRDRARDPLCGHRRPPGQHRDRHLEVPAV